MKIEYFVRLPAELTPYRDKIPAGVHLLMDEPELPILYATGTKSARVTVSPETDKTISLLCKRHNVDRSAVVRAALVRAKNVWTAK